MSQRNEKVKKLIKELSAQFLERETNRTSLVTVTDCSVSNDLKRATIFVTVLPEDKEKAFLDFAKRKRTELRVYLKKNMNIKNIPFLDIQLDLGEKHRQRIDELLREK